MVRSELYKAIVNKLKEVDEGVIQHIDLWNHNVEFIEMEEGWSRPAVFVEFDPIHWDPIHRGEEYRATATLKLHIVTDWIGSSSADSAQMEESLAALDLADTLHKSLCGLSGTYFQKLDRLETQTNHNHEDVVENIEVYQYIAVLNMTA